MRVLVVHDRAEVAERIRRVATADADPGDECHVEYHYQGAHRRLTEGIYDLLVIDLTIPMNERVGEPGFEPVQALLDELFNTDNLNPVGDVIGITREPAMLDLVTNGFGPHLMVTIHENDEKPWERYLAEKIAYARRSASRRLLALSRRHDFDALIVTAMDVEMEPYRALFDMWPSKRFMSANEFVFRDRNGAMRRGAAYSVGRSGQPSAASLTQALIAHYRPRVALMSGYCGGVRDKVALGDLVFFEAAYAWDYGKWAEEGDPPKPIFRARPDPIDVKDDPLHHAARGYLGSPFAGGTAVAAVIEQEAMQELGSIGMHLKPVASGSAVVAADEIVSRIRDLNDSMWAVDMESYGFYHASRYTRVARPDYLCVKSVSDFSNGEKGDRYHRICSRLSAELVHRLLTRDWDFDRRLWDFSRE